MDINKTNKGRVNKMNKKQMMYDKIQKHGDNLKAIFNLNIDSIKLCKQLFRLENKAHRLAEDNCNGITDNIESDTNKIIDKVKKILNTNEVFFNGDPRGYALKLCDQFSKDKIIHKDWGGYGIIAPDFREFI
tara:strand:+ start:75 stop:470 length:396 start_codon:yes stop_codon:yes gene_type:complete